MKSGVLWLVGFGADVRVERAYADVQALTVRETPTFQVKHFCVVLYCTFHGGLSRGRQVCVCVCVCGVRSNLLNQLRPSDLEKVKDVQIE